MYMGVSLAKGLLGEAPSDVVPVDDLPEAVDVFGAVVFVVQVVGVLPDVEDEERFDFDCPEEVVVLDLEDVEVGGVFD